ncbi:UBX domain-containing protein 7 [Perkinsus chesapeaki]|uniref:UBX domain-containing protein 7 n=1 Tax=Perkinsus chesapeaki TaxID=330153 RepID=A0A7J6LF46_PERCH|nr:UBX domain-containing protein 7 [Perkinsus chesapeaki]
MSASGSSDAIDDSVASFMGLTGCPTASEARQYIEMAGGNLDRAASLYFDVGVGGAAVPEENVRAAIPAFRDTLLSSPTGSVPGNRGSVGGNISYVRVASPDGQRGSTGDGDTRMGDEAENEEFYFEEEDDDDDQGSDGEPDSAANDGEKAFMNLFNLPKGLSSPLPFAEVLQKARAEKRWLIVNIQDNENFLSHSLNRDIWKQSMVQDLLKTSFILWQRSKEEAEAVQYLSYYCKGLDQASLPLVHVLDPRTGRKCEEWDVSKFAKDAVEALQKMTDFTDRYDFDKQPPTRRRHHHQSSGTSSSKPSSTTPSSPESDSSVEMESSSEETKEAVPAMPSLPVEGAKDVVRIGIRTSNGERKKAVLGKEQRLGDLLALVANWEGIGLSAFDLKELVPPPGRSVKEMLQKNEEATLGRSDVNGCMLTVVLVTTKGEVKKA